MKTALVTGTTSGIGREIVAGLLQKGFTVVAHARSKEKLDREATSWKTGEGRLETVIADLSSKRAVAKMADELAERFPKMDVIVHNAAIIPKTRTETADGLETCFATNVLAPFILTRRLGPQLRAAAPSRVIYFFGGNANELDPDDMQSKKAPYESFKVYSRSKNACALLARESAKRLAGTGISVFAVLPGLVDTEGMRGLGLFGLVGRLFFRTPQQGARTPIWVATEEGLESRSGTCFGSVLGSGWRNELALPSVAKDPVLAEKVYALCERELPP
jgi:NAD(P)-dependent dehydrogenase (short-subunit alcohol dehydrogenase family)